MPAGNAAPVEVFSVYDESDVMAAEATERQQLRELRSLQTTWELATQMGEDQEYITKLEEQIRKLGGTPGVTI